MSNTNNTVPTFIEQHSKAIFDTIRKHTIGYSNEKISGNTGHRYYVDGDIVHISTIKVVDPAHKSPTKYLMNIEIKQEGQEPLIHKCSGDNAKRIHNDLHEKYENALKRTRLTRRFQNPSFTSPKIRG